MSVFIIAEAGVNHNGNINLAYKMVDEAKKAGVDCIKFQTFKTEKIITKNTKKAEYQEKNTENKETQYEMIKKLELTYDEFRKLKKYCKEKEIIFLSTPDEEESLNFLMDELNMEMVKIGSGEITNYIYLEKIAQKNKPIILSTGMSTLGEVEKALEIIRKYNNQKITLLHCTTNYPCPIEEVNLNAMLTLKEAFKLEKGQVSNVFETPFGYEIVKVTNKKTEQKSLEDSREEIVNRILADKYLDQVNSLREKSDVQRF